ncbi:UDP-glycosyltransferase 90A1-like [Diospyros lotus]|uniref:UDP-glycosyltransferase 90A1-like n=1 Tax=Diospyros lotus TaxID=55363 RepID=UPI002252A3E7|nr:UDP-glycosyltransferase 90A1-like [Diospyros lotus]
MAPETKRRHVLVFPFMAEGHTLPLLDLSKAFSKRGIKVTIITTPSNAISIATHFEAVADYPDVNLITIPFPAIPGLPDGCQNTCHLPSIDFLVPFFQATKHLQPHFRQVLQDLSDSGDLPICVISDFFLGWTQDSCQAFGVPRLVFNGMGVLSMAICKLAWTESMKSGPIPDSKTVVFPCLDLPFVLTGADLPKGLQDPNPDDPFTQFVAEAGQEEFNCWGVIVNSFLELEGSYLPSLEPFYNVAKAWCLGPLFLHHNMEFKSQDDHDAIINWLDKQTDPASVIYISFGTQAEVSEAQLNEVAYGLELSDVPFLWVVRSALKWSWPDGLEERLKAKGKGLIVRNWVDQRRILWHKATGGFLSHCGWNSVLESVSAGVPILAWPLIAEQSLNAKFVVEGLGAGIDWQKTTLQSSENNGVTTTVAREAICKGVQDLMWGREGEEARERAQGLGRLARRAVDQGGSSCQVMDRLLHQLCA